MSEEQVFEFTLKTVHMDTAEIIRKRGLESSGKVQQFIDSEVLRRCQDYVPMDTGELIRSGIINTQIGSGELFMIHRIPDDGITVSPYSKEHLSVGHIGLSG